MPNCENRDAASFHHVGFPASATFAWPIQGDVGVGRSDVPAVAPACQARNPTGADPAFVQTPAIDAALYLKSSG